MSDKIEKSTLRRGLRAFGFGLVASFVLISGAAKAASLSADAKAVLDLRESAGPRDGADPRFTAPGGFRLLSLGEKTPEQKSYTNVLFDGDGMGRVFASGIQVGTGSSLSLQNCRLVNAPRLHIVFVGTSLSLDRCFVGKIGMLSKPGDHLEAIFAHAGQISYTRTLFDVTGSPTPPSTLTAVLFFKSTDGQIDAVIDHCIITGIASLNGNYSIQASSSGGDINLKISNTGLQRGTSGYVGKTIAVGKVSIIDGGGNYDIDTGRSIKLN